MKRLVFTRESMLRNEVALLKRALRHAARHIEEMGCTCTDRSRGHQPDCVGWTIAQDILKEGKPR